MNFSKRKILTGLAGVGTLVVLGALTPRAAKAVYSTPVTVYNTSAQPVLNLDVERQARIPYESNVSGQYCPAPGTSGSCFFYFTSPPTGYRLVVENVSGYFQITPGTTLPVVGYIEDAPAFHVFGGFTAQIGPLEAGGHTQAAFNNPTRFYVDAGDVILAVASTNWSNGSTQMTLSGYLESCAVTGCPEIQR